jgi:hypothetical protein
MTPIWTKAEQFAEYIESLFKATGIPTREDLSEYNWYNAIYTSETYRRAHLEIVDRKNTHKMYIVHATIFPHYDDPSPIWGFDVVCGANKITGAFLDYSSAGNPHHEMIDWFKRYSQTLEWNKPRELPGWAQQIFSSGMIAAGNIQDESETELLGVALKTSLEYYLQNVGKTKQSFFNYKPSQNRYCYWQRQNPRVVSSMVAMGESEETITRFVKQVLFPEN